VEKADQKGFDKISHDLKIAMFSKVTDASNYKGQLQAIVVKDKKFKK